MVTEFERLVARVMQTAFIAEPTASAATPKKRVLKRHRLLKKLDSMTEEQKQLLLLLLSEKVSTVSMHGESYAYRRSDQGWLVRSLHDGEPEHTVFLDFSACSCQDNRFRGRTCKHMVALKGVLS